jgi:DNA repair protein RecN (Recombination protein N)
LKAGAVSDRSYLEEISIKNLGIIESSTLELGRGLNVLTGETGAGKTMILTALNLVLGGKSDTSLVRTGSDRLIASATFDIDKGLRHELTEEGAVIEDGALVLTRSVTSDGKSKATAGGVTVSISVLSNIGQSLIEVHGQAANAQIVKQVKQRELLDRYAGADLNAVLTDYQETYESYLELKKRLKAMREASSKRDGEIAELEEFSAAWIKLKAVRGEAASTEDEINRLSSVEDLRIASDGSLSSLEAEESGALNALGSAKKFLDAAKGKDSKLDLILTSLSEAFYLADEAARDLASYASGLEADPSRLDQLQSRKAEIAAFVKRWGSSADLDSELIQLSERAKSAKLAIADLHGGDERISELEAELAGVKTRLVASAQSLSRVRAEFAEKLSREVTVEIQQLSMPHTSFHVQVQSIDYQSELKESDFTNLGCDEVTMLIEAHPGATKIALGKGASGGEMSRIMLGLEVVIAKTHPVGTYIFDEVDSGVGGKAAIEVGKRLHKLAEHSQVIVVTHLPQVAAWGDTHFVVKKTSDGSVTQSGVTKLSEPERVDEIARMLAGLEESSSAKEHASELLALRA